MYLPFNSGDQYKSETSVVTNKYGTLTTHTRHYKVHKAYQCMGGSIKDIYIDGIVHSYVCVTRAGLKTKRAHFQAMKSRANIITDRIHIRAKANDRKAHKAKHSK